MTHHTIQSSVSPRRGFSLVEVMMALAVFGVVTAAVLGILAQGSSSTARTLERNTAQSVLKQSFVLLNSWLEEDATAVTTAQVSGYFPLQFNRDGALIGNKGVISAGEEEESASVLLQPFYLVEVVNSSVLYSSAVGLELRVAWPYRATDNKRQELFLSNVVIRK